MDIALNVVHYEDFVEDYVKNVKAQYQHNTEELISELGAYILENPDSFQQIRILNDCTVDGIAKFFTFVGYQGDEGIQVFYIGMTDE
ncbi:hypothetical protein [Furfurilactobacillus milii]|uniref:Uncharacterized protein n=1 Tax=Furfurilactobacillus milii TaxID=2888272 RepID=A0A6N9HZF9_9LACO|nr:hypothetical protein [Furfurilactobacillus milii]MYV16070.1 hypothetical protein [Furfurilactobacillus milii]